MNGPQRILILGYGNPGRRDDGLGPALVERIERRDLPNVTAESDYQLTVENGEQAAHYDIVVFVDASVSGDEPCFLRPVQPADDARTSFSTHSASPEGVLALARSLFSSDVRGYALGIRGYEFNEFGEGLSDRARQNLSAAERLLLEVLQSRRPIDEFLTPAPCEGGGADTKDASCETAST